MNRLSSRSCRPKLAVVGLLALTLRVGPAHCDPWPIDTVNQVSLTDARRVSVVPLSDGTLVHWLRADIDRRQTVNAAFGEPRAFSDRLRPDFDPKKHRSRYIHNGVDIADPRSRPPPVKGNNVTPGSPVFTIRGGALTLVENVGSDFEYVRVGAFQYMHLAVDPTIRRLPKGTILPKGTFIGMTKTLKQRGMGPHCHLMWVKSDSWYNALSILDPWSDASPPEFLRRPRSLAPDTTHPKNIPPVRVVPNFDVHDTAHPIAFFPELFDPITNTNVPIVHGDLKVLARVMDTLKSNSSLVPTGGSLTGSPNTVPAAIDLQFAQVGGPLSTRTPLVDYSYNALVSPAQIDFQLPIFLGPSADDATSIYFRDIYWISDVPGLGSTAKPPGHDFILGKPGIFEPVAMKRFVSPISTTESVDTSDGKFPRSPNGRYEARVRAYDLSQTFTAQMIGDNELRRAFNPAPPEHVAPCLVCNDAVITALADLETGIVLDEVKPDQKLRVIGYNLFSPLEPAFNEPPLVELLQETNGSMATVHSQIAIAPTGDNRQGSCEFTMPPQGTVDPTKDLWIAASIRCDPSSSSNLRRGVPRKIRLAGAEHPASFSLLYVDLHPGTGRLQISAADSRGVTTTVNQLSNFTSGWIEGLDASEDGQRYAFTGNTDNNTNVLEVHPVGGGQPLLSLSFTSNAQNTSEFLGPPSLDERGMHIAYYLENRFEDKNGNAQIIVSKVPGSPKVVLTTEQDESKPGYRELLPPLLMPNADAVVFGADDAVLRAPVGGLLTSATQSTSASAILTGLPGLADGGRQPVLHPLLNNGSVIVNASGRSILCGGPGEPHDFPANLRDGAQVMKISGVTTDGSTGLIQLQDTTTGLTRFEIIRMQPPTYPAVRTVHAGAEDEGHLSPDGRFVVLATATGASGSVGGDNDSGRFDPKQFHLDVLDITSGVKQRAVKDVWFPQLGFRQGRVRVLKARPLVIIPQP